MKGLLILALLGFAAATDFTALFKEWAAKHNKVYATPEERAHRLSVFTQNGKFIEAENAKGHSYKLGYTRFADLTNDEYRAMFLATPRNYTAGTYVPGTVTAVDWRNKGAVTPVKDQGQCGSCWTFSTTGGIEGCTQIATGKLVSCSEQQLVDCAGIQYGNLGCNGGTQGGAMKYVIANGFIDTEASYPYTATKGTCEATGKTMAASITGFTDITKGSEAALQQSIIARPTPVSIDASAMAFQLYKSGIYCPTGCSSTQLDHAVLAVGMDTSGSDDYYIVKNSWGTSWGIQGYINMCANQQNHCGIATAASYPTGCNTK